MTNNHITEPLVSIIVPIHNGELFIERCLDSIIKQTYQTIEILCVVNGSTDHSKEKVEFFQNKDHRVHLIDTEIADLGHANNLALEQANGDYISFVDVDDWVTPDYIEELLLGVSKGYNLCKSNFYFSYQEKNTLAYNGRTNGPVSIRSSNWLLPMRPAAIYHHSLFENFKYLEYSYYEDLAAWPILVGRSGGVYYIDKPLYYYEQQNQSSIMSNKDSKHLVIDKVFTFIFDNLTADIDKEIHFLITALFIQTFWSSNIQLVENTPEGEAYLRRVKNVITNRLVGYHYMVEQLNLPPALKEDMKHFYQGS